MKTQLTITELTKEDLVNLFSTAFYGSNYLAVEYDESIEYDEEDCHEDIIANILLNGGAVKVTDYNADGNKEFARRSFNAFAFDERGWDLTTADCLMQIILFDEIVYG